MAVMYTNNTPIMENEMEKNWNMKWKLGYIGVYRDITTTK